MVWHDCPLRGSFSLDAAASVAGASLPLLASLADKSLVRSRLDDRYQLHDLVRQYASERLVELGQTSATAQAHFDFYATFVERAEENLYGPHQELWYDRLEVEHQNVSAALDRALAEQQGEAGLRMASALGFFWMHRGYLRAAYERLHSLLEVGHGAHPSVRAKALRTAGFFAAIYLGDITRATGELHESLALARQENDHWNVAWSLANLGFLEELCPNLTEAADQLVEALRLFIAIGDGWGVSHALRRLGWVATQQGDYQRASTLLVEALHLARRVNSQHGTAWSLFLLGNVIWFSNQELGASNGTVPREPLADSSNAG